MSEHAPDDQTEIVFLERFILLSDEHEFIGRIFDLSIVDLHFDNYDDLARHADCKYAIDVNFVLTVLVRRVESLNLVGNMLWPNHVPTDFKNFPVSRYDWIAVTADVFLMRYISIVDCAILLVNEIYETGIEHKKCSIDRLKKKGVDDSAIAHLKNLEKNQGSLRDERNARIHHGIERTYTDDDLTFKMISMFEHRGNPMIETDQFGRNVDPMRSFREGLIVLQGEFNRASRNLVDDLDNLYNEIGVEFEKRFKPRFRAGSFSREKREALNQ